jgi:hypothetical protein
MGNRKVIEMKTNKNTIMWGAAATVCFIALSVSARKSETSGNDILEMLESANVTSTQVTAVETVDAVAVEPVAVLTETEAAPADEPAVEPATQSVEDAVVEPETDFMAEAVVEPVAEDVLEPVAEDVLEPVAEVEVEPVAEPVVEPVAEAEVEPVAEPTDMDPLSRALGAVEANDQRSDETDAAAEDMLAVDAVIAAEAGAGDTIDDLGMDDYSDATGSSIGNLISVRLNRVGLEEAINLFAQLSGANIIVPELTEAAQISVNLKDVEWRPALQSILDSYNYELYQKVSGSNVYSVRRRPAGAPEPQVVETFVLKYATVPNAAALVRELLPPDAKISEFASRNMLVIKSTESSLSEVRTVLETIDTVRQQVFIESKFMELSDDAQKDLGIDWQVLQSYSAGTVGPTERSYTKQTSSGRDSTKLYDVDGTQYEDVDANYTDFGQRGLLNQLAGVTPCVQPEDYRGQRTGSQHFDYPPRAQPEAEPSAGAQRHARYRRI